MTPEIAEKVQQIRQISSQIADLINLGKWTVRPSGEGHLKRTWSQEVMIQKLVKRRAELAATLPPLKVIAGTACDQQETAA